MSASAWLSLSAQEDAEQSLLHNGRKTKFVVTLEVHFLWYWDTVLPRDISVAQGQQEESDLYPDSQLQAKVKKFPEAIVPEHVNCSMLIIKILHCSE